MVDDDKYRKYLEAAAVIGQITRARAEEIARQMTSGEEMPRGQAQSWVDDLIERSRKATGDLIDLVRTEVSSQMEALGLDPDELARHAADILRRTAEAGRRVAGTRTSAPAPNKTAADKAPAAKKGAAAKKSAAEKRASGQKSPAKATAKQAPAKRASAKKTSAKKASAKKTAPKDAGAARGSTSRR